MKIAHSLVITPGLCGLYESAKELILAEIALGHDAWVIEPDGSSKGMKDPAIPVPTTFEYGWADVIVDHSGCDKRMLESGVPIIHIRHGRPLNTFLTELQGGLNIYSHVKRIGADPRYVSIATMWKEHIPYWQALTGREIDFIPAPVDLERFTPDGPKHDFGGKGGEVNVVCADRWAAKDEFPFDVIHKWLARDRKNEKLHIYGVQEKNTAMTTFLDMLRSLGVLGEVGWCKDMARVYRAADYVITASDIATRVSREAMACDCNIAIDGNSNDLQPGKRRCAERYHNPKASALALIRIAERELAVA